MKAGFFVLAMFAGMFAAGSAEAQNRANQNPPHDSWCRFMQTGPDGGVSMICSAYTFEQCMASRTGQGESCFLNPLYDPRHAGWRKRNPQY